MKLFVRSAARADVVAAARWYQEQSRLGRAFRQELAATLRRIDEQPRLYARVDGDIRRAPFRRFPYACFYTFSTRAETVVILAVVHDARDPAVWKRRR